MVGFSWSKQIVVAGLVSLAAASCSAVAPGSPKPKVVAIHRSSEIRFATYNVFTGTYHPAQTAEVIRRTDAEVVALQEIAPKGAVILNHALRRDYPYRHFSNGLAVLSAFPLKNVRFQKSAEGINGFMVAEIQHPRGRMQIVNVHLDPLRVWTRKEKLMLPIQIAWRQGVVHRSEMKQVIENGRPGLPTVVAGDFNSASHAAPDQLRALGFTDSFAAVNSKPDRTPTLHFALWGVRTGRRIDYIFHDHSFETVGSNVLPGRPSDHDPVVSVLRCRFD